MLISFIAPWDSVYRGLAFLVPRQSFAVDVSTSLHCRSVRFWQGLDWFNALQFVDETRTGRASPAQFSAVGPLTLMRSVPVLWPVLALGWIRRRCVGRNVVPGVENQRLVSPRAGEVRGSPLRSGLRPVHGLLVACVCLLMLTELPEGFGRFTSYSNTYASTADFDERRVIDPVDRLWINHGTSGARDVSRELDRTAFVRDTIRLLEQPETLSPGAAAEVRDLHGG